MDLTITIKGKTVEVLSPEGQKTTCSVAQLFEASPSADGDSGKVPLPNGLRYIRSCGDFKIWVHETDPAIWNLKWISEGSRRKAEGATYREVKISLPFIVTIAVFIPVARRWVTLSDLNECFFRNEPLRRSSSDQLLVPGLLNCSLFASPDGKDKIGVDGKPVVWICSQHLERKFDQEADHDQRTLLGFEALMSTLLRTGFNYSSEMHEYASGFSVSKGVDRRIATIQAWEKATAKDRDFILKVPWVPTGYNVDEVVERIFKHHHAASRKIETAEDVYLLISQINGERRRKTG